MDATCERTRHRYLRPGPWLADLRRLAAAGLSDRACARELCRLHPGRTFTRRSVRYWRQQLRDSDLSPAGERRAERLAFQHYQGWGHLLPAWDEDGGEARWVGVLFRGDVFLDWKHKGAWTPGHELTPAEVRILSALRDHGPLTRPALAALLGDRRRDPLRDWRGRHRLAALCRKGLVQRCGNVFRLAPAATTVDEIPK